MNPGISGGFKPVPTLCLKTHTVLMAAPGLCSLNKNVVML